MSFVSPPQRNWVLIPLLLVIVGLLAGLTWTNYQYALQNPGGSDFLSRWVGTQALIYDGTSPYSDSVAERIQRLFYGRLARPGEDELRFAYPLYSQIFFLPFALIRDYPSARAFWMLTLQIALLATAGFGLAITGWRPGRLGSAVYFLFSLLWYFAIRALINGNAIILIGFFLAGALLAIRSNRDEVGGILLAFATIKPQVIVLVIPFTLIWALSHRRFALIIWMFGSLAVLVGLGMIFVPDWIMQNLFEILRYSSYTPPGSPQAVLQLWFPGVGKQIGWGLTILLTGLLVVEWIAAWGKNYRWFLWSFCITLLATQWIGIQTDPGNFVVLFIPLTLVFAMLEVRYGPGANWVSILLMLLLLVGLWWLFLETLQPGAQPGQHPVMYFPFPLFLFASLYWIRWSTVSEKPLSLSSRVTY